jgi:hypothetical protein
VGAPITLYRKIDVFSYCIDNPIVLEADKLDNSDSEVDHSSSCRESVGPDVGLCNGPETGFDSRTQDC